VVAAINVSPGVTAPATWALDPATGKISIDYQTASAATTVALGAAGDTSNLLQLLGVVGATDTVTSTDPLTLNSNRQISGLVPVALVSAGHIGVNQAIRNSLDAIAAAGGVLNSAGVMVSAGPGDNTNALALAAMQRNAFAALDGLSFESYYDTNTTNLGSVTRQAETNTSTQELLLEHLQARRESFSGVSLDEEATQLIKYQRAYQAAARGISALDEMLDTIISRMGRVGN
jgi:flagellar hook-associated protein FlgK